MTWASRMLLFFPAVHLMAVVVALGVSGRWVMLTVPMAVYALPLAVFRVHQRVAPLRDGVSLLVRGPYSAWWGSHTLQWWFVAVPALEEPLRAVPGLFSAWLRAWGATVGAGVLWSPGLVLADRPLLDVGHGVCFGYGVQISGHVVKPTDGHRELLCVVRRVRIGDRAFIGAAARLGPGVRVDPGATVPATAALVGAHVKAPA